MKKIREIQVAIESLPKEESVRFREWFAERDWDQRDMQIEADSKAGKLDFMMKEAFTKNR